MAGNELHLLPPVPGTCPVCGAKHRRGEPHDEHSAYYRMRYRRKYGRWPEEKQGKQEVNPEDQKEKSQPHTR